MKMVFSHIARRGEADILDHEGITHRLLSYWYTAKVSGDDWPLEDYVEQTERRLNGEEEPNQVLERDDDE